MHLGALRLSYITGAQDMKKQSDDKIKSTPVLSKDDLSDNELNKVTGGTITRRIDQASPKLFENAVAGDLKPKPVL
jgi:bacteriocin-like protein